MQTHNLEEQEQSCKIPLPETEFPPAATFVLLVDRLYSEQDSTPCSEGVFLW